MSDPATDIEVVGDFDELEPDYDDGSHDEGDHAPA